MALLKIVDDTKVIATIERVVVNKENTVAHLFVGQGMYFEYKYKDGEKLQDDDLNYLDRAVRRTIKVILFHQENLKEGKNSLRSFLPIQCDYAQLFDYEPDAIRVHFGDEMVQGMLQIPKGTDAETQFRNLEKFFTAETALFGGVRQSSSVKLAYAADGYTNIIYFVGYVPEVCQ